MRDKLRTINFGGACAMFCALEPAAAAAVMRDSYKRRVRSHRNEINGNGSIFRTSVSRLHTHEPKHCVCVCVYCVRTTAPDTRCAHATHRPSILQDNRARVRLPRRPHGRTPPPNALSKSSTRRRRHYTRYLLNGAAL